MTSNPKPAAAANDILTVLRSIPGVDVLPVNVKAIALEFTRLKFPHEPITHVTGDVLPGFEGMLKRFKKANGHRWAIIYNTDVSRGRQNYTLGHELGHYICHRQMLDEFTCSQRDMVNWDQVRSDIEGEANRFASFLLMPIDDFRNQVGSEISLEVLAHCAERYDVSFIAAARKWIEFTPKKAMLVVSRDGYILWSSSSASAFKDGIYFRTRGVPPVAIPLVSLAALPLTDNAEQIFQPGVWWRDKAVKEMALRSDRYDMTISLLLFYD